MSIVPTTRLVTWAGLAGVPLAAVVTLVDGAATQVALVLAVLVAAVLMDGLLSTHHLQGLRVELPPDVRLTCDRDGFIPIRLAREGVPKSLNVTLGLPLPIQIVSRVECITVPVAGDGDAVDAAWLCRPSRRGRAEISGCHLQVPSTLGLWSLRETYPLRSTVRVYPNLWKEREHVGALFLHRGTFGIHTQRQVGKGREFEKLREYLHGDAVDDIHWKATAKRNRPVTKVFQIERTQEVYVVLDASRLMARPSSPGSQSHLLERSLAATLTLALAAEQQGDLFGLAAFSDRVDTFVRARSGKTHFQACREAIFDLQPRPVTPDFAELAAFLRVRLRRRALLVVLTALDDPFLAESFVRHVELLQRQHLVLVCMLRPRGARPLFSDERADTLDDVYGHLAAHYHWVRLRELERKLRRLGVSFFLLDDEQMSAQLVTRYIDVKKRQLL